ncbi:hypothetical protein LCGC14_1111110 [marine sediment metagenome]|uniref:Uncharacterized protein n=1 Tax=marine sediment metagenome TaxID=412755 RepID=A0A0F9MBF3_9ZZZZ
MKCYSCGATENKDGTPISSWRCKACHTAEEKQKYRENPEKFRQTKRTWKEANPLRQKEIDKRSRLKLKSDALNAYSNGNPVCVCCGETEFEFLCLDHIENDGYKQRGVTGKGNSFYFWLRKNKYPQHLKVQVMCFNCNWSKKLGGVCIHKRNNSGWPL